MEKIEEFMPKMMLRVLVVEPDDCTRQILTALLRKCDYKVAAVGDGLQAWEFLKKWHSSVDLILTELDLPSVSGYALLSLITEHENCKHIPVVVMSSEDSISMVLKCMLKGAVDFLLKPVRKNELKNLWRHVWRRLAVNGPRNLATQQLNNATSIHSDDNVSTSRKSVEETKYNPSNVKVENELTVLAGCADGKLANPDLGCRYNNEDKVSVSVREDENTSCTGLTTEYQPSEESEHCRGQGAMDLIGSINNSKSIVSQTSTDLVFNSLNHSTLDLQLSLTRFHDSETKAIDESQNLNHSNSSAFSWFNDSNITQTAGADQAVKSLNSAFHSDDSPLLTCSSVYSDSINHSSTVNRESLERGGSNSSQIVDPSRSTNAVEKAVKDETFNFRELDQFRRRTSNHSAEREAALARFRMKRQGRCFEKKVRYQSRKKQAEQRPRVKGQFVRHSPY